jgi:hypothetical protein
MVTKSELYFAKTKIMSKNWVARILVEAILLPLKICHVGVVDPVFTLIWCFVKMALDDDAMCMIDH